MQIHIQKDICISVSYIHIFMPFCLRVYVYIISHLLYVHKKVIFSIFLQYRLHITTVVTGFRSSEKTLFLSLALSQFHPMIVLAYIITIVLVS
jgi:hypothetical protein